MFDLSFLPSVSTPFFTLSMHVWADAVMMLLRGEEEGTQHHKGTCQQHNSIDLQQQRHTKK